MTPTCVIAGGAHARLDGRTPGSVPEPRLAIALATHSRVAARGAAVRGGARRLTLRGDPT